MTIGWIGMILSVAFIVCGLVFTCFSFWALREGCERKGGVPCYCSLIQMLIGSVLFFTLGIKCIDMFFLQDLEEGKLIVDRVANLMLSLVLMSYAVAMLMLEVKSLVEKLQNKDGK